MEVTSKIMKKAVDAMGPSLSILEPVYNNHGVLVDFIVLYMNDKACRTTGAATKDEKGGKNPNMSFLELTRLVRDSSLFEFFARTVEDNQEKTLHTRLNLINGGISEDVYDMTCVPYDGYVVVTWHTGLKLEDRNKYAATDLFENWDHGLVLFEVVTHESGLEDLRILAGNRTFAALISEDFATLPGKFFRETCSAAIQWLPYYIKTAKTGVSEVHESYNYDLKKFFLTSQFSPAVGQVAVTIVDRTKLWKNGKTLDSLTADLGILFSSMASGFCVGRAIRDASGRMVDACLEMVNPAFELLEGYPTGSMLSKYLSDLREDPVALKKYIQAVESQSRVTFTKYVPLTGSTVEAVCSSYGEDAFVCVENDVTARVKAEESLARSQSELAEKHQIIMSSIDYASKIQRTLLPQDEEFSRAFKDHAIIWEPRDIVGGDIYWLKNFDQGSLLCLCDCTGHGTPGALLTMLVVSAFEAIVTEHDYRDTATIVWQLEKKLATVLNVHAGENGKASCDLGIIRDGCDLAVLAIANDGGVAFTAGNMRVFVCDGKEVQQIRGQKIFVGEGKLKSREQLHVVDLPPQPGQKFYIASDGLFDQIGQRTRKSFGYQAFRRIILEHHTQPLRVMTQELWSAFEEHRGAELRRDDVQLIAFQK